MDSCRHPYSAAVLKGERTVQRALSPSLSLSVSVSLSLSLSLCFRLEKRHAGPCQLTQPSAFLLLSLLPGGVVGGGQAGPEAQEGEGGGFPVTEWVRACTARSGGASQSAYFTLWVSFPSIQALQILKLFSPAQGEFNQPWIVCIRLSL